MSTAATQSTPLIPPRPSRSQEKGNPAGPSPPTIPPRPTRLNRSVSPNPDRFAPSPLNEAPFPSKGSASASHRVSGSHLGGDLDSRTSFELPGPGEEGQEYAAIRDLSSSSEATRQASTSPEQTRTIGEDLKLHAPKPTMPSQSAKQRVAAVTRTDSDRAAAFGIGRPSSTEQYNSNRSLKKKPSTASQLSQPDVIEDEHGIPEIGQRVPMYPNAGDVQAPSPAPTSQPPESARPGRNHVRKHSSRGFNELPPGSYGLHGHGVASTDKLEKAYYEKHPELLQKEQYNYLHDRPNDFSLSSEDLNKIVRHTASCGAGFGTSKEYVGTPTEQVGFQASEEYATRMSRPSSAAAHARSPLKSETTAESNVDEDDNVIHVDEPSYRGDPAKLGDEQRAVGEGHEDGYVAPILAPDEVAKGSPPYELHPAVEPPPERRGSAFEMDEPRSRPTSRPASVYSPPPPEIHSTPLEDVQEYEPLFTEDERSGKQPITAEKLKEIRQRFPSRDVWEDAPNSVYATAEVSTPELSDARPKPQGPIMEAPPRDDETPAQAFARRQEELAEKEAVNPDSFLYRQQKPPNYAGHQPHIAKEMQARPSPAPRFPSRDVWEDTPDSLQFTTTVSGPQSGRDTPPEEEEESDIAGGVPSDKPAIPPRPKGQDSGTDTISKTISDGQKPHVPARPQKGASEAQQSESAPTQKAAGVARAVGGKIAALQAGFMSDLNRRLQLGPQAPKKEQPPASDLTEEKEKAPLVDARKGRARGPQRRAPTKNNTASSTDKSTPPPVSNGKPVLSFSMTRTLFSIDEEGTMTVEEAPILSAEREPATMGSTAINTEDPTPKEPTKEPETKEPETTTGTKDGESSSQATEPEKPRDEASKEDPRAETEPTTEETKTLVANLAGESVAEETIEKKQGDQVETVESTKDEVVDRT
ncbi:hypothetical protein DL768_004090 [Monosporascus sp. mg162]|nr:hypothetical protein DL768_004090 [Monosporascus sp. mg162]